VGQPSTFRLRIANNEVGSANPRLRKEAQLGAVAFCVADQVGESGNRWEVSDSVAV